MGLFKEVKKPVIKSAAASGGDISPLRPKYVAKVAPCMTGCPGGSDVRAWVTTIGQAEAYGRTSEQALEFAWLTITERNPFPAVCGRVCPHPCERACNRKERDEAIAINEIERIVGDFGIEHGLKPVVRRSPAASDGVRRSSTETGVRIPRIAVVGAGPAGLSCAYQLARREYAVTVFEEHDVAGGRFNRAVETGRLPEPVLRAEIGRITDLGVDIRFGVTVGRDITVEQLREQFDAVFEDYERGGLVAAAIGRGRLAAETIDAQITGAHVHAAPVSEPMKPERMKLAYYKVHESAFARPNGASYGETTSALAVDGWKLAVEEAKRCMSCGMCFDCETCWMYCTNNCFVKLAKGEHYGLKVELCNGCKKCADECPCGYIDMV